MADNTIINRIDNAVADEDDLLNFGKDDKNDKVQAMDTTVTSNGPTKEQETSKTDKTENTTETSEEETAGPSRLKMTLPPKLLKPPSVLTTTVPPPAWLPSPNPFFVPKLPTIPIKRKPKKVATKQPPKPTLTEPVDDGPTSSNNLNIGMRQSLSRESIKSNNFPPAKGKIFIH